MFKKHFHGIPQILSSHSMFYSFSSDFRLHIIPFNNLFLFCIHFVCQIIDCLFSPIPDVQIISNFHFKLSSISVTSSSYLFFSLYISPFFVTPFTLLRYFISFDFYNRMFKFTWFFHLFECCLPCKYRCLIFSHYHYLQQFNFSRRRTTACFDSYSVRYIVSIFQYCMRNPLINMLYLLLDHPV